MIINNKIIKLTKRVKKTFRLGFFKLPTPEQCQILTDIGDMTSGMIDFLLMDDFKTLEQYKESVDAFLLMESKTFQYKVPLKYVIGKMIHCSNIIQIHHQMIDLKKEFGFQ